MTIAGTGYLGLSNVVLLSTGKRPGGGSYTLLIEFQVGEYTGENDIVKINDYKGT